MTESGATRVNKVWRSERKGMTREQAKQNLVNISIEEPTEKQISDYLDQVNGESKRERDRAERFKADAEKVAELQKKIDEAERSSMTDLQKSQDDLEKAYQKIAALEKDMARSKLLGSLATKGIIGEDAEKLVSDDGKLDVEVLGRILSERETTAAAAKEAELLKKTPNPDGGGGGSGSEGKTFAEQLVGRFIGAEQKSNIINQYLGGN